MSQTVIRVDITGWVSIPIIKADSSFSVEYLQTLINKRNEQLQTQPTVNKKPIFGIWRFHWGMQETVHATVEPCMCGQIGKSREAQVYCMFIYGAPIWEARNVLL